MKQTITIARHGGIKDEIDADVDGQFAVHPTVPILSDPDESNTWTVTHVPTGWLCVETEHESQARAARAEFMASGLDWSFTDPNALTTDHKRVGSRLKRKYDCR